MESIKIGVIAPANSIHTVRWVNGLAKHASVHLFSLHQHANVSEQLDPAVLLTYLPSQGKLGYLTATMALRREAKHFSVYNVHYASGYGTLARLAGISPYVLNFWGSDIFEFPNKTPVHRWLIRRNALGAARVVSTSHVMKQEIEKHCPELRDISVVPFGVDLDQFRFQSHHLSKNKLRLGTCKILSPAYAIDNMIRAVDSVSKALSQPISLDIYGDGPDRLKLEHLIQELGLSEAITIHGWTPHSLIPQAMENIDIFLLSSLQESFGVSAIEAQAAGIPVIATATAGFREVIQDGHSGIIVPVSDPDAMAEAIVALSHNQALYEDLRQAGRKQVEECYDWEQNVKQQFDILYQVAAQKTR